jgi:hypothetical protein
MYCGVPDPPLATTRPVLLVGSKMERLGSLVKKGCW